MSSSSAPNPSPGFPGKPGAVRASASLPNQPEQIENFGAKLVDSMDKLGYSKASRFAVRLALTEAIANAFHHGHRSLKTDLPVEVAFTLDPLQVRITVEDKGPGFDPSKIPDPTLDENLAMPSGRGLMLMRAYMTSVAFNKRGNKVEMIYTKPSASP